MVADRKEPKVIASYGRRRVNGLTYEEQEEAMLMYTEHKLEKAIKKTLDELGSEVSEDTQKVAQYFIRKGFDAGFLEGMMLGGDTYALVRYYKEQKEIKATKLVRTYEFDLGKGVSGVLFPDGTFQKCGNAEHRVLLEDIPYDVQLGCIYFSSSLRWEHDGVISHTPVGYKGTTDAQVYWMSMNYPYFDGAQQQRALYYATQRSHEDE